MCDHDTSIGCNIEHIHCIDSMTVKLPAWPHEQSREVVLNVIYFVLGGKPNELFVSRKHQLIILEVVNEDLLVHIEYLDVVCGVVDVNLLLNLKHYLSIYDLAVNNFKNIGLNLLLRYEDVCEILLSWPLPDLDEVFNCNLNRHIGFIPLEHRTNFLKNAV